MWRIKICGIRRIDDVAMAYGAGADAIGLNLYPESKRFVTDSEAFGLAKAARQIATADQPFSIVGVFVNRPITEVVEIAKALPLDAVQLHGDEPAEAILNLGDIPVVRAIRHPNGPLQAAVEFVGQCRILGKLPAAILLDAYDPHQPGGTGKQLAWVDLAERPESLSDVPLILAGGLTDNNVAAAIEAAKPDGVDVAGGVELKSGFKSKEKVERFVAAAKTAFS
jgi:phosphoribosylanthranilate isomerase